MSVHRYNAERTIDLGHPVIQANAIDPERKQAILQILTRLRTDQPTPDQLSARLDRIAAVRSHITGKH